VSELVPELEGRGLRVAIVRSRFNAEIGATALVACLGRLAELGVAETDVTVVSVAGALEVPLALQKLCATGKYDALVALGAVIRGETYHFEIVANQSAAGITQLTLDAGLPVANGILTTDTDAQARTRAAPKGHECAEVAVEMANLLRQIDRMHR